MILLLYFKLYDLRVGETKFVNRFLKTLNGDFLLFDSVILGFKIEALMGLIFASRFWIRPTAEAWVVGEVSLGDISHRKRFSYRPATTKFRRIVELINIRVKIYEIIGKY